MAKNFVGTAQKSIMGLPQLGAVVIVAGVIAWLLGLLTETIAGYITGIGDLGVTVITTVLALSVFTFAMGMKKGKFNLVDLIPLLIVSPLIVALLATFNLTIPVIDSTVELGASLGLVVASVILANNTVKQFGFK